MYEKHRLVKDGAGYTLILFIDPNSTEFASELGIYDKSKRRNEKIHEFVKRNFKNIKIHSVKVMIGATLLTTISLNTDTQTASAHQVDFNMSYLYFGSTDSFIKQVEKTQGNLNVTSPSYFDINADGSLKLSSELQRNQKFVTEMHEQGIKVVPFLSNHWDRALGRSALENREQLAQQIADAVDKYDLDGVNVDIENVTENDREQYTDLVRLLREKIPQDKEVSVAVAANPNGWKTGWHGSYDYKALSQYADYLMIMAYDESYQGGDEGPVASYDWVERSVKYTLDQGVPPEKIVLGLAFFGRYWVEGKSYGGYGISNNRVEELVKKYNGKVIYDEKVKSPKAVVTIGPNDPVTTIGGKVLQPGTYHIWFENNESITRKMDIVHKYNLKGTGSWSLGQEDTSLWYNFDKLIKNHDYQLSASPPTGSGQSEVAIDKAPPTSEIPSFNLPFKDIAGRETQADIIAVYKKGWMKGMTADSFAPQGDLTRAQAATIIVRALNLQARQSINPDTPTFGDVKTDHWAKREIEIINQHGLMRGKAKGRFAPEDTITREEMAVILDRIFNESPALVTEDIEFRDVTSAMTSKSAIQNMAHHGIFKGYEDQTFRPKNKITREQMASVLNRIAPQLEKERTGLLKAGVFGSEVTSLQSDLTFLGYFKDKITGFYGQATYDAVVAFQKEHGLSVDGIVGPETLTKIREEVSSNR